MIFTGDTFFSEPFLSLPKRLNSLSYEQLQQKSFLPRYLNNNNWTNNDTKKLKTVIKEIANGNIQVQVQNLDYYISHEIFFDIKSPAEISAKINELIRKSNKQGSI